MKIVRVESAVLSVPTPKPMALEFREHRGHGMALAPDAERKYRLR